MDCNNDLVLITNWLVNTIKETEVLEFKSSSLMNGDIEFNYRDKPYRIKIESVDSV